MSVPAATLQQINLYDASLRPVRERLSARQLVAWALIAALGLSAVAWWATRETRTLQREMAQETARLGASRPADSSPSPQQIAALEQSLQQKIAMLESRKAMRDTLQRGMAAADRGPSALMRFIADTIPPSAWVTEVRAAGSRLDLSGRALDASAVESWLERLRDSGRLAQSPSPVVRVERAEASTPAARAASVYVFTISAALAAPFAEEESRP